MDNFWVNALWSVTPTILVGLVFWAIVRSIIRADRGERAAYAEMESVERVRLGLPPAPRSGGAAAKTASPE
ncbi:hypothetical protein [Mycetocola saprophilus]|uniref:hypothetical protein n=1 Tax=Mycetocola saprophilus TaxID=76636 RepID=UPI0004BFB3BC|nr:hypothetical protein [Mycetocola saprophilus]